MIDDVLLIISLNCNENNYPGKQSVIGSIRRERKRLEPRKRLREQIL